MFINRFGLPMNLQLFAADTGAEGGGTDGGEDKGGDQGSDAKDGQGEKEHMIPKSRFDEINGNYKTVKDQLDAILKDKEDNETKSKEKQGEFESLYNKTKGDADKFKGDAKTANDRVQSLEGVINGLLESKLADIPEEFRDLVPANLTPEAKLAWVNAAESKGLFGKKETEQKPLGGATNPGNTQTVDVSKLDPLQMMLSGYGSK